MKYHDGVRMIINGDEDVFQVLCSTSAPDVLSTMMMIMTDGCVMMTMMTMITKNRKFQVQPLQLLAS